MPDGPASQCGSEPGRSEGPRAGPEARITESCTDDHDDPIAADTVHEQCWETDTPGHPDAARHLVRYDPVVTP
jgi:hypothetical protein